MSLNATGETSATRWVWPAEWSRHAATWVAWPHNQDTWPGKYEKIPPQFARFLHCLAEQEPVRILASVGPVRDAASEWLAPDNNIELVDVPTNDAWVRDYGPLTVVSDCGQMAMVHWQYNAWGEKYPPFDADANASKRIADYVRARDTNASLVEIESSWTLEGGAIDVNGSGDLLTTQSCLLDASRNPNATSADLEESLCEHLGVERIHWLPESHLEGDDTDGHVDQLARFCNATTIVVATPQADDRAHARLNKNVQFLRTQRGGNGRPFDVVELPLPCPLFYETHRLPASYCNFYITNEAVLVPQFGSNSDDERAVAILRELFDSRRVIALDASDLLWGLGAFHCLTQPQFARRLPASENAAN